MIILFLQFLLGVIFLTTVFLHLTKKNLSSVAAYSIQSFAVALILLNSFLETKNILLLCVVLATILVKVVLAPMFFSRLIKKHKLTFLVSTYLNLPLTLIVLAVITTAAYSQRFFSLTSIVLTHHALLSLTLATIFISLFLVINRKDAISQAVGVLSFENSVVVFAVFAGLEQSPVLQIGILFDIFVWLAITTVFLSMIYKHFGSLDVSNMKNLKE